MDEPTQGPKKGRGPTRTIESLQLNLEAARNGQTWLLLPEGHRDQESGQIYPLPSRLTDLQVLSTVFVKPTKMDSGCIYIRRALAHLREHGKRKQSALMDIGTRVEKVQHAHEHYLQSVKHVKQEIKETLEGVKREAEQAIANLTDLFALGRKGIEGQMKAHLEGAAWHGEPIDARAFRECFRMVSQAVKGLGLPSDQRPAAERVIVDELAAALEDTQDALSQATDDDEVEH